ncbi:MAG: hypothetical protein K9I94_08655 [Bacteroidales bacterium]|nr:hypothetical protein [Bacteroidales bacterium]
MKTILKRSILSSGLGIMALLMFFLTSCQKDLDKVRTPDLNPTFAVPVINSELTLGHLLDPDSTLIFDTISDNEVAIKVAYSEDSLFSVNIDEVFELPDNEALTESYSMGGVKLEDVNVHGKAVLDQLLGSINQDAADSLQAYDGEENIFPPMELESPYDFNIDPFDKFQQATFSEGSLVLTFSNYLPVTLTDLQLDLRNSAEDTLIKSYTLEQIAPGETESEPFDLAGKTLPNTINAAIVAFNSPGSHPDSVMINLQDSISMDMGIVDATVISGQAEVEAQQVIADTTNIAITPENNAEVTLLRLSKAKIDYTFNSEIPLDIELFLNLPSSELDGSAPELSRTVPAFGSVSGVWDLDGVEMDLTQAPDTAYNRLRVGYRVNTIASDGIIAVDSADFVEVDLSLTDMEFDYVEGYFGDATVDVEADSLDLGIDFFDQIEGGLTLTNPNLNFNYSNSIGVPIEVALNFTGRSAEGEAQSLNINMDDAPAGSIRFSYPQTPGETVVETITINSENSDVVDLLALPPEKVVYSGSAFANTFGSQQNFASKESSFTIGVDMDLPLEIRTGNLTVQDTADLDLDEDFNENVETVSLTLHAVNHFPFSADIQLHLFDSQSNTVIDEITFSNPLTAGEATENSLVNEPGVSDMELILNQEEFDNMIAADQMIIKVNIATYNHENQSVKLYTDNKLQVFVGVKAQLKTD